MLMTQCQNCGNQNSTESNFCRFCGTKFLVSQPAAENLYDYSPPRPYVWKTDEFQTQSEARKVQTPERVQPLGGPLSSNSNSAQPLAYRQPQQFAQAYRCPSCMSQFLPRMERRISTAGWITFAVLLVFFFPLFWIGLLIKEDVRICPACNTKIS